MFNGNRWALVAAAFLILALVAGCSPGPEENGEVTAPDENGEPEEVDFEEALSKFEELDAWSADVFFSDSEGEMEQRIVVQGENMRMEMTDPETETTSITIVNADEDVMYIYDPEENTAYEMDMSYEAPEMDLDDELDDDLMEDDDWVDDDEVDPTAFADEFWGDDIEYVGQEQVDGKDCHVFAFTGEDEEGKVWIWKEYGFPLRWEETYEDGEEMIVEYRNVVVGEVPAEEFQLPEGVEIIDFGF